MAGGHSRCSACGSSHPKAEVDVSATTRRSGQRQRRSQRPGVTMSSGAGEKASTGAYYDPVTKLAIIYYSTTGHGTTRAKRVAAAAESAGAEVRLRHVAETHDP